MTEYIFKDSPKGIKFVGDFESLYQSERDPWEQSATNHNDMTSFYKLSRLKLLDFLENHIVDNGSICECGCGIGHVTKSLQLKFRNHEISGCDISKTAIEKASKKFKKINFFQHDILTNPLPQSYNVLILSNILWYVIHDFDNLIKNSIGSLNTEKKSFLVIQNALFKSKQKYFQDIVNSIGTLTDLFVKRLLELPHIGADFKVNTQFFRNNKISHDFGILIIEIPKF